MRDSTDLRCCASACRDEAGQKCADARLELPLFAQDAALKFDKLVMNAHPQRAAPRFDLAIEFGLPIDDGPRDSLHVLGYAADLAAAGSAASMMTLSASA